MGKKEEFIEWFKQEEKSLIVAIGKEDWQNEKVYFVEEINIFVNKYLKNLNNWISVEDELPKEANDEEKDFKLGWLIYNGTNIDITKEHPSNWNYKSPIDMYHDGEIVTHWQPLSQLPKEK